MITVNEDQLPEMPEDEAKAYVQAVVDEHASSPHFALARAMNNGPDGQDWNDALVAAEPILERLEEDEWSVFKMQDVRLLLSALDVADAVEWGNGSTFDRLAEQVGFTPVGPVDDE